MLSSFKKPRKNASAAKQQKINVAKKLADRPVTPPSSDTDDDSDSEYEEILISSINGQPKKPNPKPKSAEPDEPNHANHFTEPVEPVEIKKSEPIPIPRKSKSQRVVIKKYYQQRKKPAEDKVKPQEAEKSPPPPDKTGKFPPAPHVMPSYIGISSGRRGGEHSQRNPHSTMSSRILNW